MNYKIIIVSLAAILLFIQFEGKAQSSSPVDSLKNYRVEDAPEWTSVFYRTNGWFGADGVFSYSLDGNESIGAGKQGTTLLSFSDTMTGNVVGDTVYNFKMVNNSVATIKGINPRNNAVNIHLRRDANGEAQNYFSPNTPESKSNEYYWMGDGFVNNEDDGSLNIFGYRVIDKSENSWDFELTGVTLITIPGDDIKPPFSTHTQIDAPLFIDSEKLGTGTFGSAIYVNTEWANAPNPDGFIYVYGLVDPNKKLVVARVKATHFKKFDLWQFWDGNNWSQNINDVAVIADRVSNELSITPLADGRYLMVFQLDGIGNYAAVRVVESLTGPFGPIQKIRKVPEINDPPGIIPYNAKAHPVLSEKNKLLISYNTITMDYFNDILNYPHSYRPRFFWLLLD